MAILPGTRIRANGVFGIITDNPLSAGATTYNSADLNDLPVVAGNHAIVTLDPLRQFGDPEIVMVTAHTAAATVATIQRGMFGTVARSHPVNTLWVHAATNDDFIRVATSVTRPTDQYEGQFIFETDTERVKMHSGSVWEDILITGAFPSWAPTVVQSNTPAQTLIYAKYTKVGRLVSATFAFSFQGAGTASNNITLTTLPVQPAGTAGVIQGSFKYFDAGNTIHAGHVWSNSLTQAFFNYDGFGNNMGNGDFAIANNDTLEGFIIYEAAS